MARVCVVSLVLCVAVLLSTSPFAWGLDSLKAAEISREIRQHFRSSGMNWVSPKQLMEQIDLPTNTKPVMYVFTMRSCQDCRTLMNEFVTELDHSMLSQLSAQFLAVLVLDDYGLEPPFTAPEYAPGGFDSVPRILFAGPNGRVNPEIRNPKSDNYTAYSYITAQEMVDVMRSVLKEHYKKPISLMIEGVESPGSENLKPSSNILTHDNSKGGGISQYPVDLDMDLPS